MLHRPAFDPQRSAFHVAGQISTARELNSTPFGPTPAGMGLSSPGIASDRDAPAVEMRGKEGGGQRSGNVSAGTTAG